MVGDVRNTTGFEIDEEVIDLMRRSGATEADIAAARTKAQAEGHDKAVDVIDIDPDLRGVFSLFCRMMNQLRYRASDGVLLGFESAPIANSTHFYRAAGIAVADEVGAFSDLQIMETEMVNIARTRSAK
jgi:hypothetical protein